MRRGFHLLVLAAALCPGCLCIAEFPDYLVNGDRSVDRPTGKDGPGDGPGRDGGGVEARLSDATGDRPFLDARAELRGLDGPKVDKRADIVTPCNTATNCKCAGCACVDGACEVPCNGGGATCPAGVHCKVQGGPSCAGQVFCGQAAVCTVTCTGPSACTNQIHCDAAKQCFITCKDGACTNQISCGANAYCEVRCEGSGSCSSDVSCNIQSCGCLIACDPASCNSGTHLGKVYCIPGCTSPSGCNACVTPPCHVP